MKHLPLDILDKLRTTTASKIMELIPKYHDTKDMKIYKKLESLYNNLYKICNIMEEKTGKYEGHILTEIEKLRPIYVVDAEPVEYYIDEEILESAIVKKEYYTIEEAKALIYWTINNTRKNLIKNNGSLYNLTGCCGLSQYSTLYPLKKLGLDITLNNISNVDNRMGRHAFGTVIIPILIDNHVENKQYLIDCTYSQFFHLGNSVENMYFKSGRKPHAGYFIKDYKNEELFVKNMITYGFCEATESNLKKYFYGLYLSGVDKAEVDEAKLIFNSINISNIINRPNEEKFDYTEEEFNAWGFNLDPHSNYHK